MMVFFRLLFVRTAGGPLQTHADLSAMLHLLAERVTIFVVPLSRKCSGTQKTRKSDLWRLIWGIIYQSIFYASPRNRLKFPLSVQLTLEKYGCKTRRVECPTRKLSEFASANEFFLVNETSRCFTHIFLQS
jgi:hypothetical protein